MFLPQIPYGSAKTTRQIVNFRGVRYGRGGSDGELAESLNLSSRQFPALSQRRARATVGTWSAPTAIFGKGELCVVDGTDFLYNGEKVGTVTAGEKQIVSINTKIVIWPDKKVYDTEAESFQDLGASVTASGVTFTDNSITMSGKNLDQLFAANQAVEISGSSISANNKTIVIREVSSTKLTFYNDSFTAGQSTTDVTVERKIPDLKLICASNNRVWGCDDTTIWASALGDPLTWYNYDGLSTDSYAVAVGSDGAFSGCCAYGSNVLFWKEDVLHKVMGLQPSEYQIYTYTVQGPKQGCHKSLQVINEVLYYLGVEGVYAYAGGTPYLISENFGTRRFQAAAAGTDGRRYYISMQDTDSQEWGMWTYDTVQAIWLREDETHAADFSLLNGDMLFLSGNTVFKTDQPDEAEGNKIKWSATFYPMDETIHNRKGYSKLYLRMELEPGAWVKTEIKEDFSPWMQRGVVHGERKRTETVTMLPGRCDTFQIRLSGEGRCVVKSLVREFDAGSEV